MKNGGHIAWKKWQLIILAQSRHVNSQISEEELSYFRTAAGRWLGDTALFSPSLVRRIIVGCVCGRSADFAMPLSPVLSLSLSVSRSGFARMIGSRRFPSFLSCKTIYINVAYVVCFLKHLATSWLFGKVSVCHYDTWNFESSAQELYFRFHIIINLLNKMQTNYLVTYLWPWKAP